MVKDATYKGQREVRTFADLNHAAWVMIKKSEENALGSRYTNMAALLFTAFTFEAYLNHLGHELIEFWDNIDSIKVMSKYECLCKHVGVTPDFSTRPHQTLSKLFQFRNSVAHGRTQILKVSKAVSSRDDPWKHSPKTDWEEYCTDENAKRAKCDIEAIIVQLHKAAGLGEHPFIHGATISSVSLKPA
jgi:hypothetical protein